MCCVVLVAGRWLIHVVLQDMLRYAIAVDIIVFT